MSQIPAKSVKQTLRVRELARQASTEYVCLTPDFPFDYRAFLQGAGSAPVGSISPANMGKKIAIIGAGVAGIIAAYEALRMGLVPVIFEASNRIGGRLYSHRFDGDTTKPIAELGAMRFSEYSRTIFHYFEKVSMDENSGPFPNPGTGVVPGNIVDYKGTQDYFVVDPNTGDIVEGENPWEYLDENFYGNGTPGSGLMERNGLEATNVWGYQTPPAPGQPISEDNKRALKEHWNGLIRGVGTSKGESIDTKSFRDLLTDDGWNFGDIEAFGQVGFGTGGWGTDYIHSAMEILRVIYMQLDTDQKLVYDGTDQLPTRLYEKDPSDFGDEVAPPGGLGSLKNIQEREHIDGSPFNKEAVAFRRHDPGQPSETITVFYRVNGPGGQVLPFPSDFAAVVYTPHVRVLDKMRYQTSALPFYQDTTALFDNETWEAIMYTHYQQSVKVFQAVDAPFWDTIDPGSGQYALSQTLSDRLTRGTYLLDYSGNTTPGGYTGAGVFTSYTWQDDSMKFIAADNEKLDSSWVNITTNCLGQIYDREDVFLGHANGQPSISKKWEDDPHYVCAFKYNLPGQYKYQRTLFQNFYCGPLDEASVAPDTNRFILAGDGISWTAAWAEGAAQSAINAVGKLEYLFNDNTLNPASPHGQYETWMPIDAPDTPGQ